MNINIIEHKELKRAVSAKELYKFLDVRTDYATWIKRMFECCRGVSINQLLIN